MKPLLSHKKFIFHSPHTHTRDSHHHRHIPKKQGMNSTSSLFFNHFHACFQLLRIHCFSHRVVRISIRLGNIAKVFSFLMLKSIFIFNVFRVSNASFTQLLFHRKNRKILEKFSKTQKNALGLYLL